MANATYSYSAISLRGRASLPSPSDHCSCYFLKEFVYDNTLLPLSLPLSSCCICSCSCSALTISTVAHLAAPIKPSFSCALRQSTLIQLSAPRKLFSSAARHRRYYYYRLPVYGPHRGCCELSCAERKERGSLFPKAVAEAKSRRCGYRAVGDAEAVLSLLTEGMEVKECGNGVGERVGRVRRKGRGGHVGTSECHGGEKELGLLRSSEFKSCEVENRREEREAFTFTGTSSVGWGSSTCSSVYFSSSEEDFHSIAEVQINDQRESVGVSLEECGGDVGGNGVGRYYEIRKGEDEKCRDAAREQITGPTKSARARPNDWDWRKNSEKKLTDVVTDEQKGTVEMAYRELSNTENGSNAVYCSQNCDREDESNVEERARKQYAQIGIHGSRASESRRKYKQHAQMQEVSGHKLRSTNIFQHKLNSGKENIGVTKNMSQESRKIHGQESNYISFQHESDRISHKNSTASEVHEQTSNLNWLSETLRKNQEKTATLVLDEKTRNQGGQVAISESEVSESRREYQQQHTEIQEASGHNLKLTSLSQQNNLSQEAISKNAPEDYYISCQHDSGRNSQQVLTASDVHERTSELNKRSETLRKKQEKNAALILNSNKERMEQQSHRTSQRFVKKIDSRRKFQQSTKVLNLEGMDIEHASSSQRHPNPMVSNREENLNLVFSSLSEPEQQCFQSDRQAIKRTIFRKGSQAGIKSHGISMGMNTEESYLAPVDGTRSQLDQTNNTALHIDPRIETQKPSKLSSLHEPTSSKAFGIQLPLDLEAQGQGKQIGLKVEGHRRSQTIMMPPQSQLVTRGGSETQECPRKIPGNGMRDPDPQGRKLDLQMELQDKSRRDTSGEPLKLLSHEDFMSKSSHQDKSSMEFVGDYVDNIESEVIASEIQGEQKVYELNLVYRGEEHKQKGLGKHGPSNFHSKKSDSKHSSVDFGTKGPSSGMLDVVDPAFREVSETGASEGTATDKNSIVKRSSRSLWNIVRDVFRLRWGSNGDTHNFGGKFGAKSSSDESLCSEAWFSGLEPDKKNEEIMRRKPRVPTSSEQLQPTVTPGQSQRYSSDTRSSKDDETRYFEADIPSSSSVLQSRSGSRGRSPASGYESTDRSEDGKSLQGTSSTADHVQVESSILLPSRGTRSPVVSEISDTEITEKMQQPVNTRLVKGLGTVGKDMGLSRSKLQRKDQVMKDTFDEWEEAYKMESKQRKIDEGFMREAILEAKKAADCWEVPVGAVLVQHGNVIARGCNLVEELRDSTAHAEMICIREASNVLRSWRLADTTLYVTLEPCPMCAGAILQARIKTVVWGTPNKLLGADGSWIRLFPDGGEAGNALGQTDKSAVPVHPFHPNMTVRRGVLAAECADAMQHFFQLRRRKKEKKLEPPTHLCPIVRHPPNFFSKMHHILHIIFCF